MVRTEVDKLPKRIFLDTSVVNKVVEFGEYLFDDYLAGSSLREYKRRPSEDQEDIDALHYLFQVYQRLCMPMCVSQTTLCELGRTMDSDKRNHLLQYAGEVIDHWLTGVDTRRPTAIKSDEFKDTCVSISQNLTFLPDDGDRLLFAEAVLFGCDAFLTMDRKTIWCHREQLGIYGVRVLRPHELWKEMLPWAPLWY